MSAKTDLQFIRERMKYRRLKTILIAFLLIGGLSAILKFYFKTPDIAILFLVVLSTISALVTVLVKGFINPPSWLYRIRFTVMGVFYGISIGILLFGKDAIEKNIFNMHNFLIYVLIGAVLGVLFNNFMLFSQSLKLKRRKGLFLAERQLVKDSALLVNQNGEYINGKLVLTTDHLFFVGNRKGENIFEKEVHEIHPNISKTKFLGIPNGFRIENDDILLKVPFPYYWLKTINKRKK